LPRFPFDRPADASRLARSAAIRSGTSSFSSSGSTWTSGALALPLDDLEQRVAVGVLVLLELEGRRERVDQLLRHLELLLRDACLLGLDLVDRADLVGEIHLLERDHAVAHAQAAEVLLVAHHVLRDRGQARVLHRPEQERVDLVAAVGRAEVVRPFEDDRVDLVVGNEVADVDRLEALGVRRRRLEVLVGQVDVLALRVLERLDDLLVRDRLALLLADLVVADAAVVLLVQQVEVELVLLDRAVHPHGHVDEPEGDGAGPDRARHETCLPADAPVETA
jgi:hypothetical protein